MFNLDTHTHKNWGHEHDASQQSSNHKQKSIPVKKYFYWACADAALLAQGCDKHELISLYALAIAEHLLICIIKVH